jgi:hypothetical protein
MWFPFLLMFGIVFLISYLWVQGIHKMKNEHPDYKGEDFLNWHQTENEKDNIHK